jgi:uncharacterized membrane protein
VNHISFDPSNPIPQAALWIRLPFQILFIAWAWWMTRDDRPAEQAHQLSAPG